MYRQTVAGKAIEQLIGTQNEIQTEKKPMYRQTVDKSELILYMDTVSNSRHVWTTTQKHNHNSMTADNSELKVIFSIL